MPSTVADTPEDALVSVARRLISSKIAVPVLFIAPSDNNASVGVAVGSRRAVAVSRRWTSIIIAVPVSKKPESIVLVGGIGVTVAVEVFVKVALAVTDGVSVCDEVAVTVGRSVSVKLAVALGVGVPVGITACTTSEGMLVFDDVGVALGVMVRDGVSVGTGVIVSVGAGVNVNVSVAVAVAEGEALGVTEGVKVGDGVCVCVVVGVHVKVAVDVSLGTGVRVIVAVRVLVAVAVGVRVADGVRVPVKVADGVSALICKMGSGSRSTAQETNVRLIQAKPPVRRSRIHAESSLRPTGSTPVPSSISP